MLSDIFKFLWSPFHKLAHKFGWNKVSGMYIELNESTQMVEVGVQCLHCGCKRVIANMPPNMVSEDMIK